MKKFKLVLVSLIASAALVSVAAAHSCGGQANKSKSGCRSEVKGAKSGCGVEAQPAKCCGAAKAGCGSATVDGEATAPVETVD